MKPTNTEIEALAQAMTKIIQEGIAKNITEERVVFSVSAFIEGCLLELLSDNPGVK